jgi:hypothetical protein
MFCTLCSFLIREGLADIASPETARSASIKQELPILEIDCFLSSADPLSFTKVVGLISIEIHTKPTEVVQDGHLEANCAVDGDSAKDWDSSHRGWVAATRDIEGVHKIRTEVELQPLVNGDALGKLKRFRPMRKSANPTVVLLSVPESKAAGAANAAEFRFLSVAGLSFPDQVPRAFPPR